MPRPVMAFGAGLMAYLGDQGVNVTPQATARQPEAIILKFSESVKSVVDESKALPATPLSAQGFKHSSSSKGSSRAISEVACSFLGLWKHILISQALCGQNIAQKKFQSHLIDLKSLQMSEKNMKDDTWISCTAFVVK